MTGPENPRWRDALDRAVPEPMVPVDMLERVGTAVAVAHRRRRLAAIVSTTAVVAAVAVAVGVFSGSRQAGPAAAPHPAPTRAAAPAPTPTSGPSLGVGHGMGTSASPLSRTATSQPGSAPGADRCTAADNPQNNRTAQTLRPLPADFRPTAAFLCTQDFKTYPGQGTWQVLVGQRLSGDLTGLTSALRQGDVAAVQPTSAQPSGPTVVCAAAFAIPPRLVLLDASGAAFRPRIPVDECHSPQAAVTSALRALTHSTVVVLKLQQTETQQQVDTDRHAAAVGCGDRQFKDLLGYTGTEKLSKGGPLPWRGPVSICLFTDDPHDRGVGNFQDGRRLTATEETKLIAAIDKPGSTTPCYARHTQFLEVFDRTGYTTVEIGGCSRVARQDGLGAADPTGLATLIATLLPRSTH